MAGAGYMVGKTFSIAASGTQDINPSAMGLAAGSEFDIHNIYYNNQLQISTYDGTNLVTFKTDTTSGALLGMDSHCNGSQWIRITNNGSGTLLVSFDGMQTQ